MMSDMQIPIMLGSDKATQHLLAPVQEDLVAVQDYKVGDMFIFNNGLYKVTDDIDTSDPIIIGSGAGCNADVSTQTIYEEITDRKFPDYANTPTTYVDITSTKTYTATYDCLFSFYVVQTGAMHGYIEINGKLVNGAAIYTGSTSPALGHSFAFPLRAGDTLEIKLHSGTIGEIRGYAIPY